VRHGACSRTTDIGTSTLVNDSVSTRDVSCLLGTHHVKMINIMTVDVSEECAASYSELK
jgi:hypothetical protein